MSLELLWDANHPQRAFQAPCLISIPADAMIPAEGHPAPNPDAPGFIPLPVFETKAYISPGMAE